MGVQFDFGGPQWCKRVMKRLRRERGSTGAWAMRAVYACAFAFYFESPGSTAPATLPTAFTVPTVASTARLAPVAAMPTAALATLTTAQPPDAIDDRRANARPARRRVVGVRLDMPSM
jgi:hypothetical protein